MNPLEDETLERLKEAGMDFGVYLQPPAALGLVEEDEDGETD